MEPLADLALAEACARGDASAIAEFDRRFSPTIARALARIGVTDAAADEIRQTVLEKLLVGRDGKGPSIASFEGRGPLGAWVRAVVVHAAISAKRREQREEHGSDSVLDGAMADDDPELEQMRRRYEAPFKTAFADALGELAPRERNVLRLVHVEGLAVEEVAVVYGVHRVSVSRWLGEARRTLHGRTRALLQERLTLTGSELSSIERVCLSQIDLSLERLLGEI